MFIASCLTHLNSLSIYFMMFAGAYLAGFKGKSMEIAVPCCTAMFTNTVSWCFLQMFPTSPDNRRFVAFVAQVCWGHPNFGGDNRRVQHLLDKAQARANLPETHGFSVWNLRLSFFGFHKKTVPMDQVLRYFQVIWYNQWWPQQQVSI